MKWHVDSGHGWLQVKISELLTLGVATKISGYSYMKGEYAYLEEDCDANVYLSAKYKDDKWFIKEDLLRESQKIPTREYKGDAPCRNYNSYSMEAVTC